MRVTAPNLIQQIFSTNPHEILARTLTLALFSTLGCYAQFNTLRRKKNEDTIKQAKAEIDQIFDASADGICMIGKKFNVFRMNKAFLPISEVSRADEALGKKCYDVFPSPLCHTSECPLVKILAGEEYVEYEIERVSKKGGRLWYLESATPLRDPAGKLLGIVQNLKNITSQKKAEEELKKHRSHLEQMVEERTLELTRANEHLQGEIAQRSQTEAALRESEELFRTAAQNTTELIYEWNIAEGRLNWFNAGDEFGYAPGELLRTFEAWGKSLHPEDHDRVMEAIERHLKTQEPFFQEYRVVRKDGGVLFWTDCGNALLDEKGVPYKWIGVVTDITVQREAEKTLRESENLYKMLFEEARDAVFISDIKMGVILNANRQAEKLLNKPKEEIIGLHQLSLHPPDERAEYERIFKKITQKRSSPLITCEVFTAAGRRVPVEISSSVLKLSEDKEVIQSFFRDITERKQAEKLLRKTEEQYSLFVKNFPGIAFQFDLNFKFEFLHGTVETITGYKAQDIMAEKPRWDQILLPDDAAIIHSVLKDKLFVAPHASMEIESRLFHKEGGLKYIHIDMKNICDSSGKPFMVQGIVGDITDSKRAEDALAWDAGVNAALADLSKALISLASADEIASLIIDHAQRLTQSKLGFSAYIDPKSGHLIGPCLKEECFNICRVNKKKMVLKKVRGLLGLVLENRRSLLINNPSDVPCSLGAPDEPSPIHRFLAAPSLIKDDLIGQIAVANSEHNYTERDLILINRLADIYAIALHRKRTEEEKEKAQIQLLRVQKMEAIGTLAGGLAHDFNNLLTAVMGNLSLLKLCVKIEDEASKILEQAERACQHAKNLTLQLLTFSSGGAPIKKPASIIEILRKSTGFAMSGSWAKCDLALPDNLWSAEIDEGQISQVINNLLINADQAMPQGGIIKIWAENAVIGAESALPLKEGRYVKVVIEDQGTGIAEKNLPKIFDPYFTTKKGGSGLGLAISYSIITKHGGNISVKSKVGVGTVFCFYLPASEKVILTVREIEEAVFPGQEKILFMDDQEDIRDMVHRMLTHLGYRVELAAGGVEALKLYKKAKETGKPFDVVILDLTIPGGIGGKETLQRLLEIDPEVSAIVTSGYSNDPIMSEYGKYGFRGVLCKPFQVQELSKIIHQLMKEDVVK